MSYTKEEYFNDDDARSVNSDTPYNKNYASQQYCTMCFSKRDNTVGCISTGARAWFCSTSCMTYYFYSNNLATYSQPVVHELMKMKNKYFKEEILTNRQRKLGIHT